MIYMYIHLTNSLIISKGLVLRQLHSVQCTCYRIRRNFHGKNILCGKFSFRKIFVGKLPHKNFTQRKISTRYIWRNEFTTPLQTEHMAEYERRLCVRGYHVYQKLPLAGTHSSLFQSAQRDCMSYMVRASSYSWWPRLLYLAVRFSNHRWQYFRRKWTFWIE